MLNKIEKVLDEKVRPYLNSHGGDIEIKSYEDNILKVKLIGACSNCPSARITNEELVASSVKEELPEVKEVVLIEEVSEELLDMARKILKH